MVFPAVPRKDGFDVFSLIIKTIFLNHKYLWAEIVRLFFIAFTFSLLFQQWRIQDFPDGDTPTSKVGGINLLICHIFLENCMKMKDFEPIGSASLVPPLAHSKVMKLTIYS